MHRTSAAVPAPTHRASSRPQQASSASQRVIWLTVCLGLVDPFTGSGVAAWRQGCAHCWYIPVKISSVEADLIGRREGRRPARPAKAVRLQEFKELDEALPALEAISADREPCPTLQMVAARFAPIAEVHIPLVNDSSWTELSIAPFAAGIDAPNDACRRSARTPYRQTSPEHQRLGPPMTHLSVQPLRCL